MNRKIRVGILCGGRSAEHEVSLQSAKNIATALDRNQYEVVVIGIDKQGGWHHLPSSQWLENPTDPKNIKLLTHKNDAISIVPSESKNKLSLTGPLDVIFPVLHGPNGEDGTVQGLLKLADIPFVGPSVLGSAVGMDKDVTKRLLRDAGVPIPKFVTIRSADISSLSTDNIVASLGLPLFIKPANLGSSVGIVKVKEKSAIFAALQQALRYDTKALVEEAIVGREIECSVLGNERPIASLPGEVIPRHEFYSYDAKYIDDNGADLKIPADLPLETVKIVQELAVKTFTTLCCEGMARVDFFLKADGKVLVNEINTIPGFTKISMYPKMWEASGISYSELLDKLIQLAIERHERDSKFN